MPSVCLKAEKQELSASVETQDPVKQVLNLIDKKIRNLEKRKVRLDAVREKKGSGEELNSEQKEALEKYELVLQSIEFIKELQKSVQQQLAETEKLTKKQQKKEKMERLALEQRRFRELLSVQALLTGLGEESVRADFLRGASGAVPLSEDELSKLDELYKLISPSREDNSNFAQQLSQAAEHVVHLLDGRDKPVVNTTYQALQVLVKKVEDCGYFDRRQGAVTDNVAKGEQTKASAKVVESSDDSEVENVSASSGQQQPVPSATVSVYNGSSQPVAYTTDVYYSTSQTHATQFGGEDRPLQDIVTSSPFNFIQESQIDGHSDATVAYLPQSVYNTAVLVSQPQPIFADPSHLDKSYMATTVFLPTPMGVTSAPAVFVSGGHYPAATGGMFTLPHMTHGDMNTITFSSSVLQPVTVESLEAYHGVTSSFEQQPSNSSEQQDKKPFTMNPDADEFQSMYTPTSLSFVSESQTFVNSNISAADGTAVTEDVQEQADDEQEWCSAGGYHQRNGYGPRGPRNDRGGRGFNRGNRRGFGGRGVFNGRGGGRGFQGGYNPRFDWRNNNGDSNGPSRGGRGRGFYRGGRDKEATVETATAPTVPTAPTEQ